MQSLDLKTYYAYAVLLAIASAMLTSVAGINIGVLLLLLATPWFWRSFAFEPVQKKQTLYFLALIAAICLCALS